MASPTADEQQTCKKSRSDKSEQITAAKTSNPNMDKENQIIHDSSLSIYERLRHFLFINFVLNKRSFILSILSYFTDLLLFVALNLFLFSNKKFIYETICQQTSSLTTLTTTLSSSTVAYNNSSRIFKRDINSTNLISKEPHFTNQLFNSTSLSTIFLYS